MKTRIILTILLIVAGAWFVASIGQPVTTLANNKAAVATVNGGDAEYVAQSVVYNTTRLNKRPWRHPYSSNRFREGLFGAPFFAKKDDEKLLTTNPNTDTLLYSQSNRRNTII